MLFDRAEEIPALAAKLQDARSETDCWVFVSNGEAFPGAGCAAALMKPDLTVDTDALGMRELPISIKRIVGKLRELAGNMMAGGKASVTFLLDMSWLLHTPSGIAHLGEFETCLHQLLVASPIRSICLFNRRFFTDGLILDVLRTHPYLYDTQGLRSNPHFLPPHAYLSGDPAEQLGSWMSSLGPVVESRWTAAPAAGERAGSPSVRDSGKPAGKPVLTEPGGTAGREIEAPDLATDNCLKQNRWKIRSLGQLRIYRQDGTPVRWDRIHGATVKTKTLFAMLLQKGAKGLGAEEIADMLWPDSPSMNQSLNRVYHTIHCLRMALDPSFSSGQGSSYVVCLDHRYYLNLPEGTWVDGPIFEQFCRKGEQLLKARNLEESLSCHQVAERLYSGSLFSDIPDKYAANTENDWCWSRRYWLEEMYVKMLTYTARIYRELEQADQAVIYAQKALRIEPCFELAHQEAIRAFQATGRQDAIERQYRLCCEALRRFEERAPSSQTRALFQSLVTT
jgi:two-component SAPR family response regulator